MLIDPHIHPNPVCIARDGGPLPLKERDEGDPVSLHRGLEVYDADTERDLVASIAAATGLDAPQVVIESVSFPVTVRIAQDKRVPVRLLLSRLFYLAYFSPVHDVCRHVLVTIRGTLRRGVVDAAKRHGDAI